MQLSGCQLFDVGMTRRRGVGWAESSSPTIPRKIKMAGLADSAHPTSLVLSNRSFFMNDQMDSMTEAALELSLAEMEQVQGGAICHGVSALAWARVDGVSL